MHGNIGKQKIAQTKLLNSAYKVRTNSRSQDLGMIKHAWEFVGVHIL